MLLSEKCFSQLIHSIKYMNRQDRPPTPLVDEVDSVSADEILKVDE
jgi:hypothetical protein